MKNLIFLALLIFVTLNAPTAYAGDSLLGMFGQGYLMTQGDFGGNSRGNGGHISPEQASYHNDYIDTDRQLEKNIIAMNAFTDEISSKSLSHYSERIAAYDKYVALSNINFGYFISKDGFSYRIEDAQEAKFYVVNRFLDSPPYNIKLEHYPRLKSKEFLDFLEAGATPFELYMIFNYALMLAEKSDFQFQEDYGAGISGVNKTNVRFKADIREAKNRYFYARNFILQTMLERWLPKIIASPERIPIAPGAEITHERIRLYVGPYTVKGSNGIEVPASWDILLSKIKYTYKNSCRSIVRR